MTRAFTIAAFAIVAVSGAASGAIVQHGVNAGATSTALHGGNRELVSMGFNGSSTVFNGGNFLNFVDGSLTNNVNTYSWNAAIPRDMGGQNNHWGNPDRADAATAFTGEGSSTGTLAEVFGPFSTGYKNLSYIIDGEDNRAWHMDLLFAPGNTLSADSDDTTVELAVLERGRNSDFNVYGIMTGNVLTGPIFVPRANVTSAGWNLDTLEIGGNQQVGGVGISLDSSWQNIIGFRVEARNGFNGPDIVAVGTATPVPVPTPGAAALVVLGGVVAGRRRRA